MLTMRYIGSMQMKLVTHLKSRGMNPSLYRISISYSASAVTFYLYDLSGRICGYQTYRPNKTEKKANHPKMSRYYTYLPKGKDGYFGLELLDKTKDTIYIVEGIFKAAMLHRLGFNSVAVLSNHPKRSKSWFRILRRQYKLIGIGDNDKAGQMLVNSVGKGILSPLDLDEMADEDIIKMLEGI